MANAYDWPPGEQSPGDSPAHIGGTLTAEPFPRVRCSRAIPREVADVSVRDVEHAYAFGLWCADGYWWSSSIGISNVEPELVIRFARFLARVLSPDRLRLRIYQVPGCDPDSRVLELTSKISVRPAHKMKHTAYHLYVNSRPLIRRFFADRENLHQLPVEYVGAYFAGRFDGDGSFGDTPRIAYTTEEEARTDATLLASVGIPETSVLFYKKANEFCIYIHRSAWARFEQLLERSWKITRRFTL